MRGKVSALALVVGLGLSASPAQANEKRDFESCDGRVHPARADDGMRGEASTSGLFLGRFGAAQTGRIAACDRALASDRLLPTQALRRAHLLRARAAAKLQEGDNKGALADLDLADAAVRDRAGDRFHRRSMGVSLELLRALALVQTGDRAGASSLAISAMAARPYSSQVQQIGAELLTAASGKLDGKGWDRTLRLNPDAGMLMMLRAFETGDFAQVVALRSAAAAPWPDKAPTAYQLMAPLGDAGAFLAALSHATTSAYSLAATGKAEEAKASLAEFRTRLNTLPATTDRKGVAIGPQVATFVEKALAGRFKQIEARIAVAEGRPKDAIALLVGAQLPEDAATVELLTALKAAAPAADAELIPSPAALGGEKEETRAKRLLRLVDDSLFSPETPRTVIDYEKSRPNILGALVGAAVSMGTTLLSGVGRLDGFRSTANADGTTKVEYVGNTPSALLVQEMTLLRAAELAREAKKPAFEIVARKDYQRMLQMSRGGVPMSSTPQGFKTEMTIRFLDSAEASPRGLDAVAIIDALGPLYYEAKPAKA